MAFRDLLSAAEHHDDDEDIADFIDLDPGERICAPGGLSPTRRTLRKLVMTSLLLAGVWVYLKTPDAWKSWLAAEADWLLTMDVPAPSVSQSQPASRQEPAGTHDPLAEPPPVATEPFAEVTEVAETPGAAAGTLLSAEPVAPQAELGVPLPVEAMPAPQPLPPPTVDQSDPLQKRAAASGLHPGISKAVLTRLSDTDFRNAAAAIKAALAQTPDGGLYTWPTNASGAKLALFEVRFVEGAATGCRRYVVVVTKDRWSTTAAPMETCGVKAPGPGGDTTAAQRLKAPREAPAGGGGSPVAAALAGS